MATKDPAFRCGTDIEFDDYRAGGIPVAAFLPPPVSSLDEGLEVPAVAEMDSLVSVLR